MAKTVWISTGTTKLTGSFVNNLKHDKVDYYSPAGNLLSREFYNNGVASGSWTQWWDDGRVKSEIVYSSAGVQLSKSHPIPIFLEGDGIAGSWLSLEDRAALMTSSFSE